MPQMPKINILLEWRRKILQKYQIYIKSMTTDIMETSKPK